MQDLIRNFALDTIDAPLNFSALESLPVAICVTGLEGEILYYNSAAAKMWGRAPVNSEKWCGSYDLYTKEGKFIPRHQCPLAIALKDNNIVRGLEVIATRPDNTSFHLMPFPTPLRRSNGELVGAINMMVYLGESHIPLEVPAIDFKNR